MRDGSAKATKGILGLFGDEFGHFAFVNFLCFAYSQA